MMKKIALILILSLFAINSKAVIRQATTLTQLFESLSKSVKGDSVYVPPTSIINATDTTITIPGGVTLYSSRMPTPGSTGGALIYSTSLTKVDIYTPLIQTGGEDVTISSIRLRGATNEITDFDYRRGVSKGIHGLHKNLRITNCEIFWFDMWGVYLYVPAGAIITNNYIHHCRNAGYGYGVWVGGAGVKYEGTAIISNNIFDACRSAVDASGHYSNMIVTNNTFLPEQHYTVISRHGQSNGCIGGNQTIVTNNLVLSKSRSFTIPKSATDSGFISIKNNRLRSLPCAFNKQVSSIACDGDLICLGDTAYASNIPFISKLQTSIVASKDTIKVGETVTLTATGGNRFWWKIGETTLPQIDRVGQTITYRFTRPGAYVITLYSFLNAGSNSVPAEPNITYKTIYVLPTEGTWVIAWVKDSYIGVIKDKFKKSILINDSTYWSDDIEGYEGWQRVMIRFDQPIKKISLDLRCINDSPANEIGELFCWFDGISIVSPTKVLFHDSFEADRIVWQLANTNLGSNVSTQNPVGEKRDGEKSWLFRKAIGGNSSAGWGGRLSWNFK